MPPKCKITVLKKNLNQDLAKEYCQNEVTQCTLFDEGDEFIVGFEKPEGFCDFAWKDIYRFVAVMLSGVTFQRIILKAAKSSKIEAFKTFSRKKLRFMRTKHIVV